MGVHEKRRERLIENLHGSSVLLSDPNDIYYHTGFRPAGTVFLLIGKQSMLFLPGTENEGERFGVDACYFRKLKDIAAKLPRKAGFDEGSMIAAYYMAFAKKCKLSKCRKAIKEVRAVKDSTEIGKMREAIRITKDAFNVKSAGRAERDVARDVGVGFMKGGAGLAFDTIISAGDNGYYIHHKPSDYVIGKHDMVIVDCGAKVDYCADVTRTFTKNAKQRKVYQDMIDISEAVMDKIEVGSKFEGLQKVFEKEMSKRKYRVMHSIGHSLGLEVHEPIETIKEGCVFTVEPGVYIKGFGGARFENMILVKKSGIEMLTKRIKDY